MPKDATYKLILSEDERDYLEGVLKQKVMSAKKRLHAQVLLKSDQGEFHQEGKWFDKRIAAAFDIHEKTVARIRKVAVTEGGDIALERSRKARPYQRKLDGAGEAVLLAQSCSEPPAGHSKWSLRLLSDKLVELEVVDSISTETVRSVLKKTKSNLG